MYNILYRVKEGLKCCCCSAGVIEPIHSFIFCACLGCQWFSTEFLLNFFNRYMVDRESAEKVDGKIQDALFIMVVSNSCLNPLVYGTFTRECRESMTNCCGCVKSRRGSDQRRDLQGRRRGGGNTGGLRRQSQLKMLYTSSKRPTSKAQLQSQTIAVNAPHLPTQFVVQDPPKSCK